MPQQPQIITLGRDPANSTVINGSNVSSFHARLTVSTDKIVIEDLGSTNGTSVGQVENKIQRAIVSLSDTIFLGSTPLLVSDLVAAPDSKSEIPPADQISVHSESDSPAPRWTPWRIALVCGAGVIVMGLSLFVWNALRDPTPELAESSAGSEAATSSSATEAGGDVLAQSEDIVPKAKNARDALSPEEKLRRALFVIICSDGKNGSAYRVGTAFAIDSTRVATTASVIQAMQDLIENGYANVTLRAPATGKSFDIVSSRIHPQYKSAEDEANQARQTLDTIYDELESKPPTPEAFEAVKAELIETRLNAVRAIERKTTFDVAVIRLAQPLEHWLSGAPSDASLRPSLKLEVTGFEIDSNDPFFDETETAQWLTMKSRVRQVSQADNAAPSLLQGTATEQQFEYLLSGIPVTNAQGQVVAIYSRPTPSPRDATPMQSDSTFDAPLFDRIRECLNNYP